VGSHLDERDLALGGGLRRRALEAVGHTGGEAGGVGVHVLGAAAGVEALGDEQRVGQICRILVDNALVHTPPGTTVRVQALRQGGTAVLAVEDDGPGIPEDGVRQVFERFYRLGGSVASGSGLGLAIARELAELMGGRIELDSRPGRTRFSLVLSAAPPTDELPVSTGKEPSRVQA